MPGTDPQVFVVYRPEYNRVAVTTEMSSVTVSAPGPAGPQGLPGEPGLFRLPVGAPINGHRALVLTDAGLRHATTALTDADLPCFLTENAANPGDVIDVYSHRVSHNWPVTGTLGQCLFIGDDGQITPTVPTVGYLRYLGVFIDATTVVFDPEQSVRL